MSNKFWDSAPTSLALAIHKSNLGALTPDARATIEAENDIILSRIKDDLVIMNTESRQAAIELLNRGCSKIKAATIINDCKKTIGDYSEFVKTFFTRLIEERTPDFLFEFFEKTAKILELRKFGLRRELSNNEIYNTARLNVELNRSKIRTEKEEFNRIQNNINRIKSFIYGINSVIIGNGLLDKFSQEQEDINMLLALQGVETAAENMLIVMLNDLRGHWKANINESKIPEILVALENLPNEKELLKESWTR
jgi:hypothetical protein